MHYNYTNQLRQAGLPGEDDIENGLQGIITRDQTHLYIYSDLDLTHSMDDMAGR